MAPLTICADMMRARCLLCQHICVQNTLTEISYLSKPSRVERRFGVLVDEWKQCCCWAVLRDGLLALMVTATFKITASAMQSSAILQPSCFAPVQSNRLLAAAFLIGPLLACRRPELCGVRSRGAPCSPPTKPAATLVFAAVPVVLGHFSSCSKPANVSSDHLTWSPRAESTCKGSAEAVTRGRLIYIPHMYALSVTPFLLMGGWLPGGGGHGDG